MSKLGSDPTSDRLVCQADLQQQRICNSQKGVNRGEFIVSPLSEETSAAAPVSRRLGAEPSFDRLQQSGAGFTGIAGRKLAAQFDHWKSGTRVVEGLGRGRGRGPVGAYQQEIKRRDAHQEKSVAYAASTLGVVSGTAQQFAQVGEHIYIGVEAQNPAAGEDRGLGRDSGAVEGGDRLLLRFVGVEYRRQARHIEHFAHLFRHVAELQVSASLAGAGEDADHGAEAAAVNESDLAQIEDDGGAGMQQPGNMRQQGFAGLTGNNPSVAANYGDASNLASVEREEQGASDGAGIKPAKSLHYMPQWSEVWDQGPISESSHINRPI